MASQDSPTPPPDRHTDGTYKKNSSGNKNGRPFGALETPRSHAIKQFTKSLPKAVRDVLKEKGFAISSKTYAGALQEIQFLVAILNQDTRAAKFITDLTEAPLPKALFLADADGQALDAKITVEYVKTQEDSE